MRFVRRDAAADFFLSEQSNMGIKFLGEIAVRISAENASE